MPGGLEARPAAQENIPELVGEVVLKTEKGHRVNGGPSNTGSKGRSRTADPSIMSAVL